MLSDDRKNVDDGLVVKIPQRAVSVSHLSNLLRLLQVALREIAVTESKMFPSVHLPILFARLGGASEETRIQINFENSSGNELTEEFTLKVLNFFMSAYVEFLNHNAQSDLWGGALLKQNSIFKDGVERRFAQVTSTLKKIPGTSISGPITSIELTENGYGVT
jgi:hypothetical protein